MEFLVEELHQEKLVEKQNGFIDAHADDEANEEETDLEEGTESFELGVPLEEFPPLTGLSVVW